MDHVPFACMIMCLTDEFHVLKVKINADNMLTYELYFKSSVKLTITDL